MDPHNIGDDLHEICCLRYGARKLLDSIGMCLKYLNGVKHIEAESGSHQQVCALTFMSRAINKIQTLRRTLRYLQFNTAPKLLVLLKCGPPSLPLQWSRQRREFNKCLGRFQHDTENNVK